MQRHFVCTSLVVVAGCFLGAACGGTTVVDVTEYDQSCQQDEDCVVVRDGDICCGCPNAAINVADLERYRDDLGSCSAQCDIGCLGETVAFCDDGTCGVLTTDG